MYALVYFERSKISGTAGHRTAAAMRRAWISRRPISPQPHALVQFDAKIEVLEDQTSIGVVKRDIFKFDRRTPFNERPASGWSAVDAQQGRNGLRQPRNMLRDVDQRDRKIPRSVQTRDQGAGQDDVAGGRLSVFCQSLTANHQRDREGSRYQGVANAKPLNQPLRLRAAISQSTCAGTMKLAPTAQNVLTSDILLTTSTISPSTAAA